MLRFVFFDILKEEIAVEGAKRATAGFGVQSPGIQDVGVVRRPVQTKLHQGEPVHKERMRIALAPGLFLNTKANVHGMRFQILRAAAAAFLIAKQLLPHEIGDLGSLVVQCAESAVDFSLLPVFFYGPPGDTDYPPFSIVPGIFFIEIGFQDVERNADLFAFVLYEVQLLVYPGCFQAEVTEDHGIIDGNCGMGEVTVRTGVLAGHQSQCGALHTGAK